MTLRPEFLGLGDMGPTIGITRSLGTEGQVEGHSPLGAGA
jgi:hypothetical protein